MLLSIYRLRVECWTSLIKIEISLLLKLLAIVVSKALNCVKENLFVLPIFCAIICIIVHVFFEVFFDCVGFGLAHNLLFSLFISFVIVNNDRKLLETTFPLERCRNLIVCHSDKLRISAFCVKFEFNII